MSSPRVALYQRLPEIYRIRDEELSPPGQLQAYLSLMESVHSALRDDIGALGRDAFIESCADWVIPYIADLLGTSHLAGDPWTLRADVARTINHRRRKGTLGAIESLVHALSGWAAHTVEMRERLLWNQHLNHQRPDAGGIPPLTLSRFAGDARRGGTVNLRDPALLSLLNGPFDPFAHVVDVKPAAGWRGAYNLPNLGIFLWRLRDFTVVRTRPGWTSAPIPLAPLTPDEANFAVRVDVHPQSMMNDSEPMVLFNTHRFRADDEPPDISALDAVPGPMPAARLSHDTPAGNPDAYVEIQTYPQNSVPPRLRRLGLGLQVPQPPFTPATTWRFRGANLCAWENGLHPPLRAHEVAIDPERGRLVFGAMNNAEGNAIKDGLFLSPTHGFPGPVGAQPVPRLAAPATWLDAVPTVVVVDPLNTPAATLSAALDNLQARAQPLIIEIRDSLVHELDLATIAGTTAEGGVNTLRLNRSLWIRAADGERPVIRLKRPLAFRPHDVLGAGAPGVMASLMVRLEGLYITRDRTAGVFPANAPLVARAALNQLHVLDSTLDPGGYLKLDRTRAPIRDAMRLDNTCGFTAPAEQTAFDQSPEIVLENSVAGPLAIDDDYSLTLINSIVDAGGTLETTAPALAVAAATGNPELAWGPALTVSGMTCFGRMRVTSASGKGGIWAHALQVLDNQSGCIKNSWFANADNRLPSNHACVNGVDADLHFVAETFGMPGYAQITRDSDARILEQGPKDDEMGAFGFLLNTHKWKNIHIRFREYMPVGVRPVLIAVT